jgi:hypothetical protein
MADSTYSVEETRPVFYVGEHETKRPLPVTAELVHHAQDLGVSVPLEVTALSLRAILCGRPRAISFRDMFSTPHS